MVNISQATAAADGLKAQGRWTEAIAAHEAITRAYPGNGVAFHNLAATLGDAGRPAEAEQAARHAIRLGLDAPETRLVCARAVQALGRFDEAERLLGDALDRRPLYLDALRDLAQLRWMSTASLDEALRPVDAALTAAPTDPGLQLLKVEVLNAAEDAGAALAFLHQACSGQAGDARLAHALANAALQAGQAGVALAAAQRAMALAPGESATLVAWLDALLVLGEWRQAEQAALAWQARAAPDQRVLARLATAWRMLQDTRYPLLYDYEGMVSVLQLATPPGWTCLDSYLADLAAALQTAHRCRTHPFQQSIRHGSQVPHVLQLANPAAQALASAIDTPIRQHLARLGTGGDPLRALNQGGYRMLGGWSIRMQAGGRHVNHVHQDGWISSACYIEAPPSLSGHEGCLKLGEPGIPMRPLPPAERFVEPKLGRIVLFPSYMWHGTAAFSCGGARMSVAFDLLPAPTANMRPALTG